MRQPILKIRYGASLTNGRSYYRMQRPMPLIMRAISLGSLLVSLALPLAAAGSLTNYSQAEIEHLLTYVERSGCKFYRNGVWYGAETAEKHLRLKYELLKDSLDGTEDFIEKAASRSSLSGQAYEVKCDIDAPMPSAQWLHLELQRFRATAGRSYGSQSDQ